MRPAAVRALVRSAAGLVLAALLLLVVAAPAAAHAELVSTDPAAGAALDTAPATVELRFSEQVDPVPGGIRLVRSDGTDVGASVAEVDGDGARVRLTPDERLGDGTYVVAWRVTSADSHPVRGAFTFRVGAGDQGDTAALINRLLTEESGTAGAGVLLAVGRWLSYAGVLLAAGFLGLVALGRAALVPRGRVLAAAVLAVVGTAVLLAGQAVSLRAGWSAAVSPGAWSDVVATRAGGWWALRLAAAALTAIVCAAGAGWRALGRRAPAALAAAALCTVASLGGHAQSGRWVALGFTATVAHLAAAALWSAGLVVAVVLARRGVAELGAFLRWFSPVALVSVAALVGSGVLNGVRQVGGVSALRDSDYGRLLVVKVVLVAVLVAVAATSRRATQHGHPAAAVRPVRIEVGLLAAVLLVTAVLVNQRPAIAEQAVTETGVAVQGERTLQLVLDPAAGGTALHVYITSPRGSLDKADAITVTATLEERDIGPLTLEVFPAGPNHVTNPAVDLPLPGRWSFQVDARYGDFELVTFRTTLQVRG